MLIYIITIFKPKIPGHMVCQWRGTSQVKAVVNPEPVITTGGRRAEDGCDRDAGRRCASEVPPFLQGAEEECKSLPAAEGPTDSELA